MTVDLRGQSESIELRLVLINNLLGDAYDLLFLLTSDLHPLVFHGLCEANFGNLGTYLCFNFCLEHLCADFKSSCVLEFWGAFALILCTLFGQLNFAALNHVKHDKLVNEERLERCIDLCWCKAQGRAKIGRVSNLFLLIQLCENMLLQLLITHLRSRFNHSVSFC